MTHSSDDLDIPSTISRNAGVMMLGTLIYLVTRLFLPPYILKYLSLNEYGIWTYCFIIVGYLGMGIYGISNVYVRYIAVYNAHNQLEKINRLAATGVLFSLGLCLLCVPLLWFGLPYAIDVLKVTPDLKETAFWIIFGTSLLFLFDMIFAVFASTLQSLHKFTIERGFWTLSVLIEAGIILATLAAGWGLYGLLAAFGVRILLFVILCAIACKRLLPTFSIAPSHADRQDLHYFYNYGGVVQTTGILSIVNRSLERLLAGLTMGPSTAALYDIGEKFPTMATQIPSSINAVILPATSHLHAKERHHQLVEVYLKSSRWINIITGMMMGFMAPFAFFLITIWLGSDPKYAFAPIILVCFTIAYQMDVLTGPGSATYRGINRPFRELFYPLSQFLLVLGAFALLFSLYGASIWTINASVASMMVLSALIYIYRNNRFLEVPQWHYFKHVFLPGLLPYLIGGALYLLLAPLMIPYLKERWTLFYTFLGALTLYLLIAIPLYYFIFLDREERLFLKQRAKSFLFKG